MDDDEDLYGETSISTVPVPSEPKPVAVDQIIASNGVVAHLEAQASREASLEPSEEQDEDQNQDDEDDDEEAEEESEDDIEFIMETPVRKMDFRQNRPPPNRTENAPSPQTATPSLTTEYTPKQRGESTSNILARHESVPTAQPSATPSTSAAPPRVEPTPVGSEGPDPNSLPPVTAPASHPEIDPTATGVLEGRSILEVDLSALADKPWRRPGSDLSDYFNYGFDELSWEAYCYRRRDLGELGNVLKQNVVNFAGMPEEQLTALPMEVRQMVMTGATALMSNGGNPNMMGPNMNPMMDMSMMGPMGMGMNSDMSMHQQMQQNAAMLQDNRSMFPENPSQNMGGNAMMNMQMEQVPQMMQEGFSAPGPSTGMMPMGMGGDYSGQDTSQMSTQSHSSIESPTPPQGPQQAAAQRGGVPTAPFRGRGQIPTGPGMRGTRGVFPGRGRGRGMPVPPARPASPLPPNVPTGPRNQNKYKDRDNNGPAVDGLDYGGGKDNLRTHSGEPEDRNPNRKRRGSPGVDDPRGPKRR